MDIPDIVNGAFEISGGAAAAVNCVRLVRDEMVMGVDWRVTAFWTCWGLWNLFYYPHLHQWASFIGGIMVVAGNGMWVYLSWRYRNEKD